MDKHYFSEDERKALDELAKTAGEKFNLARRFYFSPPVLKFFPDSDEKESNEEDNFDINDIKGILWFVHKNFSYGIISDTAHSIAIDLIRREKPITDFLKFLIELRQERRCKPILSAGFFQHLVLTISDDAAKKDSLKFIEQSLNEVSFSDLYSKDLLMNILIFTTRNCHLKELGYSALKNTLLKAPKHTILRFEDSVVSSVESREYYHTSCESLIRQISFSSMKTRDIINRLKTLIEPAVHYTFDRYVTKKAASYMINRIPVKRVTNELSDKIISLLRPEDYTEIGSHIKNKKIQEKLLLKVLGGD